MACGNHYSEIIKYLGSKTLSQVADFHFWRGLLNVKETFLLCMSYNTKDGFQIRFWQNTWRGNRRFSELFPNLYHLAYNPHDSVEEVLSSKPWNLSFRGAVVGIKQTKYDNQVDTVTQRLHKSGQFSIHSMYQFLIKPRHLFPSQLLWEVEGTITGIFFFLWYLLKGIILTKDNLAKKIKMVVISVAFVIIIK